MNKVLITGSNGFLGKILKSYFSFKKMNVISLGQNPENDIVCDLSSTIPKDRLEIDIVVHAAGKAHSLPKTQEEEKHFFDVNYQGTKNLCSAIDKLSNKPKSFIFISTVSVYGLEHGENISEDYPLLGNSPYAKSKILAEEFLAGWAKKNQIILGILRLPLIAGPNPPGNLGAMINGIRSGKYLSIGKANAKKSIVWAKDIADIILILANKGGIYNLTDGYHPSFGELENAISNSLGKSHPFKIPLFMAKAIARIGDLLGAKSPINSDKLKKITSTLTFDDSKARKELGWNPAKVLDKIPEIV